MTVILEWSGPWQTRPGIFRSDTMIRVWWGFGAVAFSRKPLHDLIDARRYDWYGARDKRKRK